MMVFEFPPRAFLSNFVSTESLKGTLRENMHYCQNAVLSANNGNLPSTFFPVDMSAKAIRMPIQELFCVFLQYL